MSGSLGHPNKILQLPTGGHHVTVGGTFHTVQSLLAITSQTLDSKEGSADSDVMAACWQLQNLVLAALPHGAGSIVFVRHDDFQFLGNTRKRVAVRKGELNRAGSFCSCPMAHDPIDKRAHKMAQIRQEID